jgi:hypothetical protein
MFPLIAVVAALGSALAYGITAVTEQLSTKRVKRRRALSPELLLDLLRLLAPVLAVITITDTIGAIGLAWTSPGDRRSIPS